MSGENVLGSGERQGEAAPPWLLALVGAVRDRLMQSTCEHAPDAQIRYYWCDAPVVDGEDEGTQINFYPRVCPDCLDEHQGFVIDVVGLLETFDKVTAVGWVHQYCEHHQSSACFLRIAGRYNSNRVELCLASLPSVVIGDL